jgi:hypothetical protein
MMGVGVMATPGLIKGARGRFVKEGTWCTLRGMGKSPQKSGGRQRPYPVREECKNNSKIIFLGVFIVGI